MPTVFRDEKGSELTANEFDAHHGEKFTQAGHGFAVGNFIYRDSATTHAKAQADDIDTIAEGVVAYISGNDFRVITKSGSHVTWTHALGAPPQKCWLSQGTPGVATTTRPTSGVRQQLGNTVTSGIFQYSPDPVGEEL